MLLPNFAFNVIYKGKKIKNKYFDDVKKVLFNDFESMLLQKLWIFFVF